MLGYMIDLNFQGNKLAKEIDENGYRDRNINHEIKRKRAIEQEICCDFTRIDNNKYNQKLLHIYVMVKRMPNNYFLS